MKYIPSYSFDYQHFHVSLRIILSVKLCRQKVTNFSSGDENIYRRINNADENYYQGKMFADEKFYHF